MDHAYATNSAEVPETERMLKRMTDLPNQIANAAERLESLCDRLFGPVPTATAGSGEKLRGISSGLLPQMQDAIAGADQQMSRLFGAIERLGRI